VVLVRPQPFAYDAVTMRRRHAFELPLPNSKKGKGARLG